MKPLHAIALDLGLPVRRGTLGQPVTETERLHAGKLVLEYITTLVHLEKMEIRERSLTTPDAYSYAIRDGSECD